jgi:hypothetical protein
MEDNIVESIKIMGHDVRYIPREVYDEYDDILGEAVNSKFSRAYTMEMYLANVQGYEGDGDFFSKFGLEVRDTSNFVVSRRSFERYVPSTIARRPREGDLIWVPLLGKLFEIKFVEEELMFFSLGKRNPFIYELRCEVFRYSNEDIETGIEEIDDVEHDAGYAIQIVLSAGVGNYNMNEHVYQGADLATSTASGEVKNWYPSNNTIQLYNVVGTFSSGSNLIGNESGTTRNLVSYDDLGDFNYNDDFDNRLIQTEANTFVDFTETNPFGMP